ncbi:MAG: hypothetical protein KKB50_14265 [Planctomycetes bacterium]|nr:hypothetical protein [Planctomycetota bacterium]
MRKTLAVCLTIFMLATPWALAVTLQQPGSSIIRVTHIPCWVHADHVCSVALHPQPARLMPAGGSGWFQGTMGGQYPGYTMNNGGTLNGTLRIQKYDAYNDDNPGGAEFRMYYEKGTGDPDPIQWAQGILTNHRLNGPVGTWASYMDVKVDTDPNTAEPPLYPYQYPDLHFYDKPARPCPDNGVILWVGEAYVTQTDTGAQTMTIYDGVEWGFIYTCFGTTRLAADDGTGTTGATTGSRDSFVQYTPTGTPWSGTLSFNGPINIMNTTGGDELDPIYFYDPLLNCNMAVWGLEMVGEMDSGGGYQFVFTGAPDECNMEIVSPGGDVVLQGQVLSIYVNDALLAEPGGFNMVAVYGDLYPVNFIGSAFMELYSYHLNYQQDGDYFNAPKLAVTTIGPFSEFLGDGTLWVEGFGTVKHGFSEERGVYWYQKGDLNCDGLVNGFDIDPFIEILDDPTSYGINYPDCPGHETGDINGDGYVNGFDIDGFVAILGG